jgi:hypothetical protein
VSATSTFDRSAHISRSLKEDNDCSVLALARVLDISYENAHHALAEAGRAHAKGTPRFITRKAIEALGFTVRRTWSVADLALAVDLPQAKRLTTAHPLRGLGEWAHLPPMLVFISKHILALRDGQVLDWTDDANAPIECAWEISKRTDRVVLGERLPPVIHLKDRRR